MWNLHLTFDCVFCGQKLGEDFARFLWPSQNIWSLMEFPKSINQLDTWPFPALDLEMEQSKKLTYLLYMDIKINKIYIFYIQID